MCVNARADLHGQIKAHLCPGKATGIPAPDANSKGATKTKIRPIGFPKQRRTIRCEIKMFGAFLFFIF